MAAPLPPLPDELIGEVLLRLPPSDPACLFRACTVCRSWLNLVSDRGALRRYHEHHRIPPVLGFFHNERVGPPSAGEEDEPRFVPTSDPSPPFPAHPDDFGSDYGVVLDSRHGRVLVYAFGHASDDLSLRVWEPITDDEEVIPLAPDGEPAEYFKGYAGAVLCAAADGGACDHHNCAVKRGPFRVVFACTGFLFDADAADDDDDDADDEEDVIVTWVRVYSSETGDWTEPTIILPPEELLIHTIFMGPSLLLGDTTLYFTLELLDRRVFLVYDLGQDELSTLDGPPDGGRDIFPVAAADGGLGAATVEGDVLRTWSGRPPDAGEEGESWIWMPQQSINLVAGRTRVVPLDLLGGGTAGTRLVVGYAEDLRIVFVSDNDGVYMVDLESGRVDKASTMTCLCPVLPYAAFYTYGLFSIQMLLLQG